MKNRNANFHLKFVFYFLLCSFIANVLAAIIALLLWLTRAITPTDFNPLIVILILAISNIIIGTISSLIISRRSTVQMNNIVIALHQIGDGNFDVELDEKRGAPYIRRLKVTVNKMAKDLRGLEIMRTNFINDFSHDFKTPMSAVLGYAKRLERTDLTAEKRQEYIEIIIEESSRLLNLANNTLQISKLENTHINIEKSLFRIDEQIRNCVIILEKSWAKKNININVELDEAEYNGSSELLKQVWINLLDNAIKFTPDNGVIDITLKQTDRCVVCSIKDSGCGIEEKQLPFIFTKFYQANDTRNESGNGLGLSIVKRIITLHDSEISVESKVNEGTSFSIILK